MSQVVLQTPIPTSESEMLVEIAVLIWLLVTLRMAHSFDKIWKYFGDAASFLLYFLGLLFLEIALF